METGRWVQKDPIFGHLYMPQILNMYVYVTNNPINYIDPSGLITSNWWKILIASGIVLIIAEAVRIWLEHKLKEIYQRAREERQKDPQNPYAGTPWKGARKAYKEAVEE